MRRDMAGRAMSFGRTARNVQRLISAELHGRDTVPFGKKLWGWRRGFTSESTARYGLTPENVNDYVSDTARYLRTPRINGPLASALLDKLVQVHHVVDLTVDGQYVERELALVKVAGEREQLVQALRIADFMQARLVDSTTESFVFEITGASRHLDAFVNLVEPLGLCEISRAGVVAIARGQEGL